MGFDTFCRVRKTERPSEVYTPTIISKEAKICLECQLPSRQCKPGVCKRYKEEMRKIKEEKRNGKH